MTDFNKIAKKWQKKWEERDIFKVDARLNKKSSNYFLYF